MSILTTARQRLDARLTAPRANFWCHVVEGAFWSFGDTLVGGATVFPLLAVQRLGVSNSALGMLHALVALSWLAPVVAAPRMERVVGKKSLILWIGFGARLPVVLIIGCLLAFARPAPLLCFLLISLCIIAKSAAISVSIPVWNDLVAETIPPERTARMFGFRTSLSAMMGAASGPACGAVLAVLAFPGNYVALYALSLLMLMVSWGIFALVDDIPPHAVVREKQAAPHYFLSLLKVLRDDRRYRYFILYRVLASAALVVMPFYAIAAARYHGLSEAVAAASLIMAGTLARAVGALGGPLASERVGLRKVIAGSAVLGALAALGAAFAPAGAWGIFLTAVFVGRLGLTSEGVSRVALGLRIYPRGRRVGYSTLSMVSLAAAAVIGAPIAGMVMDRWGHTMLLYLSAAAVFASLAPLKLCVPPEGGAEPDAPA